jgi:glycogen operon protein
LATQQPPRLEQGGAHFSVWSEKAEGISVCIFDGEDREVRRIDMKRQGEGRFTAFVEDVAPGTRYGLRARGRWDPANGHRFDENKLLVDPAATLIDREFVQDKRLCLRPDKAVDTAPLMPKAILERLPDVEKLPPLFEPGGLIYEVSVRSFTRLHLDVPEKDRGTLTGLRHPAVIEHLKALGVGAVELMPVTAAIDEPHLGELGLTNAWGYNPVAFMALDPRLAPRGIADLRDTVAALRQAGIGTILDLVFNHTGEGDDIGPTLSLRGLDSGAYYRHADGEMVNDTGCGNTVDCAHPAVVDLVMGTLRHFVRHAGVDGFRFDLAPILGRNAEGFDPNAPLLKAMREDPVVGDRVLIAEPWDIGPGGYQVGNFGDPFIEWNDRYRDDVRKFWRGDGSIGALATRLAGSFDLFDEDRTRSVNFIAAHDGMTLADITAFEEKHNEANGEDNRDGHDENLSWNNGVEGATDDEAIIAARRRDRMALLGTLFASRGTPMLTAGDEFGRTQGGNNNAYCHDDELSWLDWAGRDRALEDWTKALSDLRRRFPALREQTRLAHDGEGPGGEAGWYGEDGTALDAARWEEEARRFVVKILATGDEATPALAIVVNGNHDQWGFTLAEQGEGDWEMLLTPDPDREPWLAPPRSVTFQLFRRRTDGDTS